jgi:hypothetical protein
MVAGLDDEAATPVCGGLAGGGKAWRLRMFRFAQHDKEEKYGQAQEFHR